ncbi:galectin-12 isoform X2 [Neofelis nebulosa]|uniref:galectin-12 isoform X2 n=1 Tax=Neofelis nebulosa TaxID=61452 RepID=UPI00272B8BCF|nr:galectin-12 isoform X2 [Neofelis nebulosa]
MSPGEKPDPLPDTFILQPPVFHPVVPYVTTIFGGLRAGKMVTLQGVVPLDARRFQVDFQCGCSVHPRPDIAIHFNPRFHTTKPHVICNTLYLERWQAEARWPRLGLQRGASFLILFLFGNEEMKVSVNGQHFLQYRYRLPLSRVDTLGIFGDILVEAVGFLNINPFAEGSIEYPVGYPFLLKSPSLEVPCSRALPKGLWPGQVIVLRGLVLPEPKEQNSGLDRALGVQEADLGPLPVLPPAIFRGAAPVPGGRAEAGAQRAGPGGHQRAPAGPGAAAGAPDQWQRPALLCPLLRSEPGAPPGRRRTSPRPAPLDAAPLSSLPYTVRLSPPPPPRFRRPQPGIGSPCVYSHLIHKHSVPGPRCVQGRLKMTLQRDGRVPGHGTTALIPDICGAFLVCLFIPSDSVVASTSGAIFPCIFSLPACCRVDETFITLPTFFLQNPLLCHCFGILPPVIPPLTPATRGSVFHSYVWPVLEMPLSMESYSIRPVESGSFRCASSF